MIRNYFKIAVRNLLKNKTFSFINIFGLSVGVACCVILSLYIQDEFSYEKHFAGHERVYRIYTIFFKEGNTETFPRTSPSIAMDLAGILPEIEVATRMVNPPDVEQHLIRYQDKVFFEKRGFLVDSTFFDVFPYEFSEGVRETALDPPSTVVISDVLSRKIFGDRSPLDELIAINSGRASDTFRITGVLKTTSRRSHADADFYMTMHSDGWGRFVNSQTTWAWNNFVSSYVRLKPSAPVDGIDRKMAEELEKRAGDELKGAGLRKELHLQPLDDIRLYSSFQNSFSEESGTGNIVYIYILGSIGVFILLIACINFMNLTTAKAAQRACEVGIRKSMGAHRSNLIGQFLGESFTIVLTALVLSLVLVAFALPQINQLTQKSLSVNETNILFLVVAMAAIGLVTGLIAGSYPAFFLSAFEPSRVLKNKSLNSEGSSWIRKGLVVFQFVIAITLISSIFIVQQQLMFIREKPLGFRDRETIMVPLRTREATTKFQALKNEFVKIPGVTAVSATSSLPSTPLFQDFALYKEGSSPDRGILHRVINVDQDYFKVLDIKMLAGRDFLNDTDTFSYSFPYNKIIVNEASLRSFGIPVEEAIGAKFYAEFNKVRRTHEVVGVIRDFHQFSLHQAIAPMIFVMPAGRARYSFVAASIEGSDYNTTVAAMKDAWDKFIPSVPFESQLLRESVKKQYESDDRISLMLTWSTGLAILISCMGLYGLSIFVAERKVKEIGIRKVLGASVSGIVRMLSREFIVLVMVAFVIAVPLGYYAMSRWLENFAYKIDLGWAVFVAAGVLSFLIAFLTVGFESVKAAVGNPIKALRSE